MQNESSWGVAPLDAADMTDVNGGWSWTDVRDGIEWVGSHYEAIKQGAIDGWNAAN